MKATVAVQSPASDQVPIRKSRSTAARGRRDPVTLREPGVSGGSGNGEGEQARGGCGANEVGERHSLRHLFPSPAAPQQRVERPFEPSGLTTFSVFWSAALTRTVRGSAPSKVRVSWSPSSAQAALRPAVLV